MKEIKATDECRHELGYKLMRPIVSWNFKRKYHPVVIGGENIPKTGPLVFCGNHRHKDDQYNVMLETKRVIHMLSKDEYFKGKSAWFYRAAGCIPVDRSIHDENAKSEARAILHSKGCIGLFPEGTRNEVTCKDEELEKLEKILNLSKEEIIDEPKNEEKIEASIVKSDNFDTEKWLNDIKSKNVIINVIASSTCPHCHNFNPIIEKVATDNNVKLYFIEVDKLENEKYIAYTNSIEISGYRGYVPYTFITYDGKVVSENEGGLDSNSALKLVKDVLKQYK